MPDVRWLSLDIGYESLSADTCSTKPHLQDILESLLPREAILDWALGSITTIGDVSNDDWVADFIRDRINAALAARHLQHTRPGNPDTLTIGKDDVCGYLFRGDRGNFRAAWTGTPGTRCKLRGKIWINERSYVLRLQGGAMWLANQVPADSIVFATLTWECHVVGESNLQSPTVII